MAMAFAAPFLILLLAAPTVFGTDYTVGDTSGWALGVDYTTWAKGKTFKVGDTLLFKYDSTHQVDEVDKSGYDGCSTSKVIKNHNDGNTKITLSKTGNQYFICPTPGHCAGGMKLAVNVVAATSTPPKSSPSGSPPKPSPTPSGSPTTPAGSPTSPSTSPSSPSSPSGGSSSAPSPKSNGAVSAVSSGFFQLLGSLVVSGVLLGRFMF